MLREAQLFEYVDKVVISIELLKAFEPPEGYYLAFSGGKDSCVIKQLAIESGVKFDAHYAVTTIDPPDLIYFIRRYHKDVVFQQPDKPPFLKEMVNRGFPLGKSRWCCADYKERYGEGRKVLTGIRRAESSGRSNRKEVEHCLRGGNKQLIQPILRWSDKDVWQFIRDRDLPYCGLYDEGWKRIGCLFCPMASVKNKKRELARYPKFEKAFRRAFRELHLRKDPKVVKRWRTGDEMFDWWIKKKQTNKDKTLWLFEG